jgi:hypothetical protein
MSITGEPRVIRSASALHLQTLSPEGRGHRNPWGTRGSWTSRRSARTYSATDSHLSCPQRNRRIDQCRAELFGHWSRCETLGQPASQSRSLSAVPCSRPPDDRCRGTDAQWIACANALGLDDLARDSSLAANAGRLAARDRIVDAVAKRLAERESREWIAILGAKGVPCGVVNSVLDALDNVETSPLTGIAPSVPGSVRLPPPRLDEHGAAIRRDGWASVRRVYPATA